MTPLERRVKIALGAGLTAPAIARLLPGRRSRLHRQIAQYGAFSQSVIELTKIVSDGMASVNKSSGV